MVAQRRSHSRRLGLVRSVEVVQAVITFGGEIGEERGQPILHPDPGGMAETPMAETRVELEVFEDRPDLVPQLGEQGCVAKGTGHDHARRKMTAAADGVIALPNPRGSICVIDSSETSETRPRRAMMGRPRRGRRAR